MIYMFSFSKKTRNIFIIAWGVFLMSGVLSVYSYNSLREKEEEYKATLQLLADYSTQAEQAAEADLLLQNTELARSTLDDYFLSVIQIAYFLETVEQYAQANGLEIVSHTIDTEETETEGISIVQIPFSVYGLDSSVIRFVELLETIPYHGYIHSLRIDSDIDNPSLSQAEILVRVSYLEND